MKFLMWALLRKSYVETYQISSIDAHMCLLSNNFIYRVFFGAQVLDILLLALLL